LTWWPPARMRRARTWMCRWSAFASSDGGVRWGRRPCHRRERRVGGASVQGAQGGGSGALAGHRAAAEAQRRSTALSSSPGLAAQLCKLWQRGSAASHCGRRRGRSGARGTAAGGTRPSPLRARTSHKHIAHAHRPSTSAMEVQSALRGRARDSLRRGKLEGAHLRSTAVGSRMLSCFALTRARAAPLARRRGGPVHGVHRRCPRGWQPVLQSCGRPAAAEQGGGGTGRRTEGGPGDRSMALFVPATLYWWWTAMVPFCLKVSCGMRAVPKTQCPQGHRCDARR
jgi:hypothetical protein